MSVVKGLSAERSTIKGVEPEQGKLIRKLVSKIELGKSEIKIWFHVGDEYIKRELASASSSFLSFPEKNGSSNLTSGGP